MRRWIIGGAVAALAAGGALAHHGWGSYDTNLVTLEGPVLASKYEFPHGEIEIEGQGKRWTIVLAPPSRMQARGVTAADIAVGKRVKAEGYPSRAVATEMRAERITIGGKVVEMR